MSDNREALREIGDALAKHFDSLYYVDIETGHYEEIVHADMFDKMGIPMKGDDFFADNQKFAEKCTYPDDIQLAIGIHEKEAMLERLSKKRSYSTVYRLLINGRIEHVRHIEIMCGDGKHIICCLEILSRRYRIRLHRKRISSQPNAWQDWMILQGYGTKTHSGRWWNPLMKI